MHVIEEFALMMVFQFLKVICVNNVIAKYHVKEYESVDGIYVFRTKDSVVDSEHL